MTHKSIGNYDAMQVDGILEQSAERTAQVLCCVDFQSETVKAVYQEVYILQAEQECLLSKLFLVRWRERWVGSIGRWGEKLLSVHLLSGSLPSRDEDRWPALALSEQEGCAAGSTHTYFRP